MDLQHQLSSEPLPHRGVSRDLPVEGRALGDFLRQARESRGMTLRQISHATKIPERHLDALEHGDLAAIPSGPYRRGEIMAYAQVVGVDAIAALARLEGVAHDSPSLLLNAPSAAAPRVASQTRSVSRVVAISVLGGLAIAIAVAWMRLSPGVSDVVTRPGETRAVASQPSGVAQAPTVATTPSVPAAGASATAVATAAAEAVVGTEQEKLALAAFDSVLIVNSDPPGARVTVNGIGYGSTPATIHHLTSGDKRIRITGNGFTAEERVIRLSAERPTSELTVTLKPVQ